MAGVTQTFRIDMADADGALGRIIAAGEDLTPLSDAIGSYLVQRTQQRFDEGVAPDGTAWKPVRRGGKPLVVRGALRNSISHQADGAEVLIGTNVISAAVHQFGAVIEPKNAKMLAFRMGDRLVFARKVTIPARPFLGLGPDDIGEIEGITVDYIVAAAEGTAARSAP